MDFKGFYDEIIFDVDRSILKSYTGKQGDTKSRGLYVTVTQKNAVIEDLTGLSMRFFYEKPDKTRGFIDGVVDGNKFRIDYTNQMYAVPGVVKAELRLTGPDGEIITAKTFKILVDGSIADGSIVSKNERGILDRAFELAEDIIPRLELLDVELLEDVQDEMLQSQLKVAKVEKELNDYKATMQQVNINQEPKQKAAGYGVISLPPNAAEGQVSVTVKGNTYTNIIKNGSFENDNDNWRFSHAGTGQLIIDESERVIGQKSAKISNQTSEWISLNQTLVLNPDDYYILTCYVKVSPETLGASIRLRAGNTNIHVLNISNTSWERKIIKFKADSIDTVVFGSTASFNGTMWIDGVQINKITLEEFNTLSDDQLLSKYPYITGTKSTVGAVRIKSVGKNLFDKKIGRKVSDYIVNLGNSDWGIPIRLQPNTSYTITRITNGWNNDPSFLLRLVKSDGSSILNLNISGDISITFITDSTGLIYLARRYGSDQKLNNLLNIVDVQIEKGDTATPYEPYRESNVYITAKNEAGNILELRSLPNGTKDEISLADGKMIKRVSNEILLGDLSGWSINTSNTENYYGLQRGFDDVVPAINNPAGTTQIVGKGAIFKHTNNFNTDDDLTYSYASATHFRIRIPKSAITGEFTVQKGIEWLQQHQVQLTYQLAEPVEIPIQVSGSIASYPSGTIYIEPVTTAAGIYSGGIEVTYEQLGIKELETISKIDYMTGIETFLDVSKTVISEDGKSFTHPDLEDGDIVFFEYIHNLESTTGETEVEYYDSRFVFKDRTTGKFYKVVYFVDNGVLDYELVEV